MSDETNEPQKIPDERKDELMTALAITVREAIITADQQGMPAQIVLEIVLGQAAGFMAVAMSNSGYFIDDTPDNLYRIACAAVKYMATEFRQPEANSNRTQAEQQSFEERVDSVRRDFARLMPDDPGVRLAKQMADVAKQAQKTMTPGKVNRMMLSLVIGAIVGQEQGKAPAGEWVIYQAEVITEQLLQAAKVS